MFFFFHLTVTENLLRSVQLQYFILHINAFVATNKEKVEWEFFIRITHKSKIKNNVITHRSPWRPATVASKLLKNKIQKHHGIYRLLLISLLQPERIEFKLFISKEKNDFRFAIFVNISFILWRWLDCIFRDDKSHHSINSFAFTILNFELIWYKVALKFLFKINDIYLVMNYFIRWNKKIWSLEIVFYC